MKILKKITRRTEMGVLVPMLLLWVITYFFNHAFFSATNMVALFRSISITLIGTIGTTFVFCCGMMDLSIGALSGLSGMVAAICMVNYGVPTAAAIIIALLVAALFGILNGIIVNQFGIPAFIATLGTQYIGRGIVNVISHGRAYNGFPDNFNFWGGFGPFGIPWSVYIALILSVIAALVLKYTVYGRSLMAVGGNAETARVSGINVKLVRIEAFVISAVLSGFAGILTASRLSTAQATAGTGWEMTVVAAAIIGGVSMFGGSASILGAAIGVSIMETLTVSMTMMKVDPYWQKVAVGVVIVLSVGIDTVRRRKLSGGRG